MSRVRLRCALCACTFASDPAQYDNAYCEHTPFAYANFYYYNVDRPNGGSLLPKVTVTFYFF